MSELPSPAMLFAFGGEVGEQGIDREVAEVVHKGRA